MIEELLLQPGVQEFIRAHENDDESELVLKHKTILGVPSSLIAEQIKSRRKAKYKLPLYYQTKDIIFPPGLNIEQASSQQTAVFKSQIVSQSNLPVRKTGVDLTGGLGIDTFLLSKEFEVFHYVEPNGDLLKLAKHDHQVLSASNIQYHHLTAEAFLDSAHFDIDFIFVDPSRRKEGQKIFMLKDCHPDVEAMQDALFSKSELVLIKLSPLLDIQLTLKTIRFVKDVYILSIDNEVKELLFFCKRNFNEEPSLHAVNLSKKDFESFSFKLSEEKSAAIELANPEIFIYEPYACVLKAGAFKTVAARFGLKKLHPHTHLYTNDSLVDSFPGRIFKKIEIIKADQNDVVRLFPERKCNIIVRNFPSTVEQLKKKLKLNDGGPDYILAGTTQKEKILIAANRLK